MNDEIREQLSALVDGELPRDQVRFLLRRIDTDAQLARTWTSYQLAGGVLRRQTALMPLRDDFSEALMQRLAGDSTGLGLRVLRWAGGGAIAAAVAVFALVSTRPVGNAPESAAALAAASPPVISAPAPAASQTRIAATPLQPAFDFAQPAAAVISLPRYRHEIGGVESQEMLGPYVLLTSPQQQSARAPEAQVQP